MSIGDIKIFFSYAREDEFFKDELEKQLSLLKRQGLINGWSNRDIKAGQEWASQINQHLDEAQIILLLISPDFIASDYCYGIEMKHALEKQNNQEGRVIPIILRPVDWEDAPFSMLPVLPAGAKPVTSWLNREEAFLSITKGIRSAVIELLPKKTLGHWFNEATTHFQANRFAEALVAYEQVIRIDPNIAVIHYNVGTILAALNNNEGAIAAYQRVLQLDPNFEDTYREESALLYYNLGNCFSDLKRYGEAITAYDRAIHLNPTLAHPYHNKAEILYILERYEEALSACDQSIALDPTFAATYRSKGNALADLHRYEEALAAYDQAIQLSPHDPPSYGKKGIALMALKRYEEAVTVYEQIIEFEPNHALAHYGRGMALEYLGKSREAQQAYEKARLLGFSL